MAGIIVIQLQFAEICFGADKMLFVLRGNFRGMQHTHGVAASPSVNMVAKEQQDVSLGSGAYLGDSRIVVLGHRQDIAQLTGLTMQAGQ